MNKGRIIDDGYSGTMSRIITRDSNHVVFELPLNSVMLPYSICVNRCIVASASIPVDLNQQNSYDILVMPVGEIVVFV